MILVLSSLIKEGIFLPPGPPPCVSAAAGLERAAVSATASRWSLALACARMLVLPP